MYFKINNGYYVVVLLIYNNFERIKFKIFVFIRRYSNNQKLNQLHAVSRTHQSRQRESSIKTLLRHQSEEMKI